MILQRNVKIPVWGWAGPGEKIHIIFKGKNYTTITSASGKWQLALNPSKEGGPFDMQIKGESESVEIKNILVGDVWLCSGQSNMVLDFNNPRVKARYPKDIESSANDNIRHLLVQRTYASFPVTDCKTTGWKSASPQNLSSFSAAAYFFARNLYEKYRIPIGLINSSYGGTVAEAWVSEEGLKKLPQFAKDQQFLKDTASLNQRIKQSKQSQDEWNQQVEKEDKGFDLAGQPLWAGYGANDTEWKTLKFPDFWDKQGLSGTFGVMWTRKEIEVPADRAGRDATLFLGRIDDSDVTYFNGQKVGESPNRDIHRQYKVPGNLVKPGKNVITIRILNMNGTGGIFPDYAFNLKIGDWTGPLKGDWKYREGFVTKKMKPNVYDAKNLPDALFNAMIAPLIPYAIKGALWYQGEYNAYKAHEYRSLLPALITNWRELWRQGEFPVVIQQLPNFKNPTSQPVESEWAELREAQSLTVSKLKKVAVAVAIDLGEADDIHPVNKKDVGYRLALAAERLAYGEKKLIASGPVYKSMKAERNKIIISFDDTGSGLVSSNGSALKQFAIAGADKKFVWAKAEISGKTVIVSSDQVKAPVAVRYAWANNPEGCNLYNREGLPASPFRTDDWPGITANK